MPKHVAKSNSAPMQSVIDIHTSAGAVYRLTSRVDEFYCGGCGKRITGEQIHGAMGPDNPFDEALEGSPLCMDCRLNLDLAAPVEVITYRLVPVDEVAAALAADPTPTPKARRQPKRPKTLGSVHTHSDPLTVRALHAFCQNLLDQGAGETTVAVLAESVVTRANVVSSDRSPDGEFLLIVGHEHS